MVGAATVLPSAAVNVFTSLPSPTTGNSNAAPTASTFRSTGLPTFPSIGTTISASYSMPMPSAAPSDSSPTGAPSSPSPESAVPGGLSLGAKILIGVGAAAGAIILAIIAIGCLRHRKIRAVSRNNHIPADLGETDAMFGKAATAPQSHSISNDLHGPAGRHSSEEDSGGTHFRRSTAPQASEKASHSGDSVRRRPNAFSRRFRELFMDSYVVT